MTPTEVKEAHDKIWAVREKAAAFALLSLSQIATTVGYSAMAVQERRASRRSPGG